MIGLQYRSGVPVDDLGAGECTAHRGAGPGGRFWLLWACVPRDDTGELLVISIPVAPSGEPTEKGPGGRTWGLVDEGGGSWRVVPSINVGPHGPDGSQVVTTGVQRAPAWWHHHASVVGAPVGEAWATGGEP